ncbi:hypothetical protein GLOTRDRAFT_133908 [Gloeophyllum trabeum ATCC 11539]|uniref:Uncharacterized protein n=1 Tax=Gloeophyllum trabeum (strain ATCC 11539 / FP-39264 / Madison 617) TaxID=670483 RepID=S7PRV9_GLOTA|nr:uncharacterized protein GLOTRDRAFT_133908 [Gloeophyllum trabeum ATCC 11539]EPQ50541.1 hypothetical protein GLOTRDRAFT_133908 [Gloeophyllum trabeum ATCC 11539]
MPSGSSNPGLSTYPTPISQMSYSQGAPSSASSSPSTSPDEFLPSSVASEGEVPIYPSGDTPSIWPTEETDLLFRDIAGKLTSPTNGYDVPLQEGPALEGVHLAAYVGFGGAGFGRNGEPLGTLTEPAYTSDKSFLGGMMSGVASTMDGYNIPLDHEAAEGYDAPVESGAVLLVDAWDMPLANELAPGGANSLAYAWPHERLGQGENELNGAVVEVPLAHRWALTNLYEMPLEGWPNANGGHLSTQAWSEETLYHGGNMLYAAQTGPIVSVGLPSVNSPVSRNWSGLTSSGPYMYETGQTLYEGAIQVTVRFTFIRASALGI